MKYVQYVLYDGKLRPLWNQHKKHVNMFSMLTDMVKKWQKVRQKLGCELPQLGRKRLPASILACVKGLEGLVKHILFTTFQFHLTSDDLFRAC